MSDAMTTDPYAAARLSADNLARLTGQASHDAAVVLGSGWAPAADAIGEPAAQIPLADLGGFTAPTVAGHLPMARSVVVGQVRVLVFLGRTHLYEGHPIEAVVHGVPSRTTDGIHVTGVPSALTTRRPSARLPTVWPSIQTSHTTE